MTIIISAGALEQLARDIVRKAGGDQSAAEKVASRLVRANLTGHDSHGVGMLPAYVNGIRAGELYVDGQAEIVQDKGPFLLVDGNRGFGHVVAEQAMNLAIDRAKSGHFAVLSLRNSFHLGRVADWAEMAAEAGFIAIHYVNVLSPNSLVAPFGGREHRFATNPYCTAIPATQRSPMLVLDMATSTIAQGKVRVAYLAGREVPDGSLIDSEGHPTNDPAVMFEDPKGALTTFGRHKGFGLALLCDILGGSFSGGGAYLPERALPDRILNNMLTILLDPDVFGSAQSFFDDMDRYSEWVRSSRPPAGGAPVVFPGDPERAEQARRSSEGVPVDDGTWQQLETLGQELGVAVPIP